MQGVYAERAARAYTAMQRTFGRAGGLYRRDGRLQLPGSTAHLWPYSRAFVATLDMAGVPAELVPGFDAEAAISDHLLALERYWDSRRRPPAYSSDLVGARLGGDRYYDDNAWVGLALVQLERLRPGSADLERAQAVFQFAASGWDHRAGGVFWVEQGRGLGARNHDRNAVSTAPNAQLALHLEELGAPPSAPVGPREMYDWVLEALDASRDSDDPGTGLFWDKWRGDGTLDRAFWSYNQGSMVGLNVLLARRVDRHGQAYLRRAEAIAGKALRRYAGLGYEREPAAFTAIFFRNLLLLRAATADPALRADIIDTMRGYTDFVWEARRDRRDQFHLRNGGVTLLNQSAMVQLLALLAWDPDTYARLT
jgi:Glycosyl hydrolase family 76